MHVRTTPASKDVDRVGSAAGIAMRFACLMVIAMSGCYRSMPMLVRDIQIAGDTLVITRCPVDDDVPSCTITRQFVLPYVEPPASYDPNLPDALRGAEIVEGVAPVRAAVTACGDVAGVVDVRLTINEAGRVIKVEPNTDDTKLAACMSTAFGPARFPRTHNGGQAVLQFHMQAPPRP